MIIQICVGQGPEECQLAVGKLFKALQKECYDSIAFTTKEDLSDLEGTIRWICKSPFRPGHKRKNWYVDVSVIPEKEEISRNAAST